MGPALVFESDDEPLHHVKGEPPVILHVLGSRRLGDRLRRERTLQSEEQEFGPVGIDRPPPDEVLARLGVGERNVPFVDQAAPLGDAHPGDVGRKPARLGAEIADDPAGEPKPAIDIGCLDRTQLDEHSKSVPACEHGVMTLRFGVLGAANISQKALYDPVADTPGVELAAIAARNRDRAEAHAEQFGIARVYDTYEEVLADPEVHAIYNPLPISLHHEWSGRSLNAGKHVLSEKPFAANARLARQLAGTAERTGLLCVEAFHWRYHPLAARIAQILESGVLGEIQSVDAAFDVYVDPADDVRQSFELGGGALMDLGCYPVQWARFVMPGDEPNVVSATMRQGRPGVDVDTVITIAYPNGVPGELRTRMTEGTEFHASLTVVGADGTLEVWNPLSPHTGNRVRVESAGIDEEVEGRTTYHYQLEAFEQAVVHGNTVPTGGADAIANMDLIDAAYRAAGLPVRGEPFEDLS